MEIPIRFLDTQNIAPETFLIRQLGGEGLLPDLVLLNTMVIRAEEPVIVDTGAPSTREGWLEKVFELVEPDEVRWVYLSHDDPDHTGALFEVLEACPNARLVTNWFTVERMAAEQMLPLDRLRLVNPGETFDVGDRALRAVMPPTFDSPTTRGLHDPTTGVFWAADGFASSVPHEVAEAGDLDPDYYRDQFLRAQRMVSPWHQWLDPARYNELIDQSRSLDLNLAVGAHGPVVQGRTLDEAYRMCAELPHLAGASLMGQGDLDILLELLGSMPAPGVAA